MDNIKVIIIGGSPFSGKSSLAKLIGKELDLNVISTDDIGEILSSKLNINPMEMYDYRDYYIDKNIDELIEDTKNYHKELEKSILNLIEKHSKWGQGIIIEGWALYPEFLQKINKDVIKFWIISDKFTFKKRIEKSKEFYEGAKNEKMFKKNYIKRNLWHNNKLKYEIKKYNELSFITNEEISLKNNFFKIIKLIKNL